MPLFLIFFTACVAASILAITVGFCVPKSFFCSNSNNMEGSKINFVYSYNPNYDWDTTFVSYDQTVEVDLLDYVTWVYNQCNTK